MPSLGQTSLRTVVPQVPRVAAVQARGARRRQGLAPPHAASSFNGGSAHVVAAGRLRGDGKSRQQMQNGPSALGLSLAQISGASRYCLGSVLILDGVTAVAGAHARSGSPRE